MDIMTWTMNLSAVVIVSTSIIKEYISIAYLLNSLLHSHCNLFIVQGSCLPHLYLEQGPALPTVEEKKTINFSNTCN